MVEAKPLPESLVTAVRDIADTLGLPREPNDEKDWLNPGPAFLRTLGLPDKFEERAEVLQFGALTVRIASRADLISLKLWSATAASRGTRRAVDIADLRDIKPSVAEIVAAVEWCAGKEGRADFLQLDIIPVLQQLGIDRSVVHRE